MYVLRWTNNPNISKKEGRYGYFRKDHGRSAKTPDEAALFLEPPDSADITKWGYAPLARAFDGTEGWELVDIRQAREDHILSAVLTEVE